MIHGFVSETTGETRDLKTLKAEGLPFSDEGITTAPLVELA